MNKLELRKLLADLESARKQVKDWPDDGPGGGTPSPYTAVEQAALLDSSPFASSLQSFHNACMKTAFLPAEDQIETVMEIARKQFAGKIPLGFVVRALLSLQPQFAATRYRLARAVQPMGKKLDPLAAAIGAVRLHDKKCGPSAAQHLSEAVIKAFQQGDKATLARIKKLSSAPLRRHRNSQIWFAIDEMIKYRSHKSGKGDNPSVDFSMPTTSDIRRYVTDHAGNEAFNDLPGPKDHKGWTRLWLDSGADLVIPKGVRGKIG